MTFTRSAALAAALVAGLAGAASATTVSPTRFGQLPDFTGASGGVVLDAVGFSGARLVAQLPSSSLWNGVAYTDPFAIGTQGDLSPELIDVLGGGFEELAVRVTLFDGDTAPGDIDFGDATFLLNGFSAGDMSAASTTTVNAAGQPVGAPNAGTGFKNERTDVGFFHVTDEKLLASVHQSILETGELVYGVSDRDTGDNGYDFTRGAPAEGGIALSGLSLQDSAPMAETPVPAALPLLAAGAGALVALRRRRRA